MLSLVVPTLTAQLRRIHARMPAVFNRLLPASQKLPEDGGEEEMAVLSASSDNKHLHAIVLAKLQSAYCRDTLGLPIRGSQIAGQFCADLSAAYRSDYDINIAAMATRPVRWFKKLSFTDPCVLTIDFAYAS